MCVFILRSLLSSDRHCAGPQRCQSCRTDLALVLGVMKLGSGEAKKQTGRDKGSAEEGAGHCKIMAGASSPVFGA